MGLRTTAKTDARLAIEECLRGLRPALFEDPAKRLRASQCAMKGVHALLGHHGGEGQLWTQQAVFCRVILHGWKTPERLHRQDGFSAVLGARAQIH